MSQKFGLHADITTTDLKGVEALLRDFVGAGGILRTDKGFTVKTIMSGESARELNRSLLSALRRVSKATTLRAEWTHDGLTERFFDYVPKGIRKA